MTTAIHAGLTILRRREVEARTGLSHSSIYDKINPKSPLHDPSFPRQVSLGAGSVGWIEEEVVAWIASRMVARDQR